MATVPGNFFNLTLPEFIKGISDALINDNQLLKTLDDRGNLMKNQGGNGYEFRVRVLKANIGGFTTDWGVGNAKPINTVRVCNALYRPAIWRLFENMLQADRNAGAPGASRIANLLEEDLNTIKQEADEHWGTAFYGNGVALQPGDDADAIPPEGLESIIDDSGTYFGLSRSTYPALQSTVVPCVNPSQWDNGLQNNLMIALNTAYIGASKGQAGDMTINPSVAVRKERPDVLLTTSEIYNIYAQSQWNQYLYTGTDKTINPIKSLAFGEAMMTWCSYCTADRVYVVNTKHLMVKMVGNGLFRQMMQVNSTSPVGTVTVLGGQAQMSSENPRYLAKVEVSGE